MPGSKTAPVLINDKGKIHDSEGDHLTVNGQDRGRSRQRRRSGSRSRSSSVSEQIEILAD